MSVIANEQGYKESLDAVISAVTQVLANKGVSPGPIGEHTTLSSLSLDSLDLAEIVIQIELNLKIEIDTSSLKTLRHLGDLAMIMGNSRSEES